MNRLGIWINDKEYLCDVNEHTTCDEVIRLLIKPPAFVNEIPHTFDVNASEHKLDKLLFAQQSDTSNNNSNGSMDENRKNICDIPRESRLALIHDSRIKELCERINLLDATIEIYDNNDTEDGLSEDEIIENQITRIGMLLKKQSVRIKHLKQQHTCLYTEKVAKERLTAELEQVYCRIKIIDDQLQRFQSTLDVLNLRSDKHEIINQEHAKTEEHSTFTAKYHDLHCSCSPKLSRNKFTIDYKRNRTIDLPLLNYSQTQSRHRAYSADHCGCQALEHDGYSQRLRDNEYCVEDINPQSSCSNVDTVERKEKKLLTRKELLSLTFGLKDEQSSVLV